MARNALSAYRGVAISLATLIGFLFMLVSCVRLQRVVARQQEHIALLEARAAAAVAVPPASAPPKPPPPAPAAAVAHPPMVYPVLHYLNLKAENVFRAVLMARHPKASKDTLVIEIGSNDGKQALWAAQQVQAVAWVPAFNPKGGYNVISFEPAPAGFKRCQALKEKAGTITGALEFRNVAISNTKGAVHFIDNGVVSRIVNASTSGAVKVRTTTLSEEVDSDIAFLKIDVEGHEMAVLQGMTELFERHTIEFILMEHNPTQIARHGYGTAAAVLALLHSKGYDLYDLRLFEFQGPSLKHVVSTEENRWRRPHHFLDLEAFFTPAQPASPWGAWTDIFAVRRPS